jgi:hypothetical protein
MKQSAFNPGSHLQEVLDTTVMDCRAVAVAANGEDPRTAKKVDDIRTTEAALQ